MSGAPLTLWLFWTGAALAVALIAAGLLARRLKPAELLTPQEWKTAAQIAGILVMILVIVYFQNAHRYDAKEFIYGRF